jgi:hypothetical protein
VPEHTNRAPGTQAVLEQEQPPTSTGRTQGLHWCARGAGPKAERACPQGPGRRSSARRYAWHAL